MTVGESSYSLSLWDSIGGQDYSKIPIANANFTSVCLICFSTVSPESLEKAKSYAPEVLHQCPSKPFLLVGTQTDLKEDSETLQKLSKCIRGSVLKPAQTFLKTKV